MENLKKPYIGETFSVDEIWLLVQKGCRTVLVPVGVTEQHGYHLTTFTDCHLPGQSVLTQQHNQSALLRRSCHTLFPEGNSAAP